MAGIFKHGGLVSGVCVLALAGAAQADSRTQTARNKPASQVNLKSFILVTDNSQSGVGVPAGWTANQQGNSRTWHITANAGNAGVPPGMNFTATVSRNGQVGQSNFTHADYDDANGNNQIIGSCGDPLGVHVVNGGANGADYLGYSVPAGQYGYFYQQWAPSDAVGTVLNTMIQVGAESGAYNFQVLNNSFAVAPGAGFDRGDLSSPPLVTGEGFVQEFQQYMEPADATGLPGIATGFSFNPMTGVATMDFAGAGGLGAGMTSSIVGYTSAFEPTTSHDNVSYTYDAFGCPQLNTVYNGTLVPFIPTPGAATLLVLGAVCAARRRR